MRQLVFDTETTGLNPRTGDRIIEIGAVELINRRLTGNNLHIYVNPERDSDPGALAVHGLTTEFLSDKPKFAEIVDQLCDYIDGADLIIHNAPFDIGFMEAEFKLLKRPPFLQHCGEIIDTLAQAKSVFPGKRNSLDALCDRFGISNAHRTLHGALLDSELLAEVYLSLTRGQESLVIEEEEHHFDGRSGQTHATSISFQSLTLPVLLATEDEMTEHERVLKDLDKASKGKCIWMAVPTPDDTTVEQAG